MFYILILVMLTSVPAHKVPYRVCADIENNLRKNLEGKLIWQEEEQIFVYLSQICFKMLKNFIWNNNTLRITVHQMLPYTELGDSPKEIRGFVGDIWNIFEEIYKFDYILWPVTYSTGIKLIESGKSDIFLGAIIGDYDMFNVQLSQPYITIWYNLYMKSPNLVINSTCYIKPFSKQLWIASIIFFTILSATIWVTGKVINRVNPSEPNASIPSCILGVISGLLNQGYDLKFHSYSARAQVYLSAVLGLLLYSALSAVLYSRMTIFDLTLPINSLGDVWKKEAMSVCVRTNSYIYGQYFRDENGNVRPKWKRSLNNENCLNLIDQQNIKKIICKDGVVVFENNFIMSAFLKRTALTCDVVKLNHKFHVRGNLFLLAKHLPCFYEINTTFIKIKSSGVLKRLEKSHRQRSNTELDYQQKWYEVTMNHISGVLILYFGMVILSLIILEIEILCDKKLCCRKY